ncbi:MAG: Maf family nucleotide pyrophosphatase [Pseudomonadota bacterium]
MATAAVPPVVLASGSRYRAAMLERLGIEFRIHPADLDESRQTGENGPALARRLSLEKARCIQTLHPEAVVIGADQVAVVEPDSMRQEHHQILGKPGTHERAMTQLKAMRGHQVVYYSGLAVVHTDTEYIDVVSTCMRMRSLSDEEIDAYLTHDQPFDCAGSMRSESLGISLVDEISSSDPSALIGLPLIQLSAWLRALGFAVP